jgi:hypothetical protein
MAHRLGWNRGYVVAATDEHGRVWVGFRCSTCGQLNHAAPAYAMVHPLDKNARPRDEAFT